MFRRSKNIEKVYESKQVEIWKCPECVGWMQKGYSMSENPLCSFCSTNMAPDLKNINVLVSEDGSY